MAELVGYYCPTCQLRDARGPLCHGHPCKSCGAVVYGRNLLGLCTICERTYFEQRRQEESERVNWESMVRATGEAIYIRYGDLPPAGYSRNQATGEREAGVSVYHAYLLPGGQLVVASGYVAFCAEIFADRPLYRVEGEVIGVGSDGEPLLAGCRIVEVFN